jgi:hypothetical protein
MEKKIKFDLSGYYKPTPKNFRKFGDTLLGMSQFLTGYAVIMEEKWLALICIMIGTIGKGMTNFFTEEVIPEDRGYN